MRCSEFDARMQMLLDERKVPANDPALRNHACNCATCYATLEAVSRLFDSLELLEPPDLPTEFAQRVVDGVGEPATTPAAAPPRLAWPLAVTAAAALLLCAGPLAWYLTRDHPVVAQPKPRNRPPAGARVTDNQNHQPAMENAAGEGWLISSSILDFYSEETRQRHRQQMHKIADELRPIAAPFNAALTAIRRSIPIEPNSGRGDPHAESECPATAPIHDGSAFGWHPSRPT